MTDRNRGLRMKPITNQATNQQRLSRKGGDTGIKERILSRILTVCCIKGMTLMIEIRDYRGSDYEHEKHVEKYAAGYVVWKDGNFRLNQFNQ
jgi:hypothetical protein